jgi:hypothetical protein
VSTPKPHRRLSLTQPTSTPLPDAPRPIEANGSPPALKEERQTVVRVMAYLTEEEGEALDEVWLKLRRLPSRPSKSDILRAALAMATADPDRLTAALAEQQVSTLSRQRSSKEG